jgi:hypothetical protein
MDSVEPLRRLICVSAITPITNVPTSNNAKARRRDALTDNERPLVAAILAIVRAAALAPPSGINPAPELPRSENGFIY